MPKSFKITLLEKFDKSKIDCQKIPLKPQYTTNENPPFPTTNIYRNGLKIDKDDFEHFLIEHEMEENAWGRYGEEIFNKFIRKERIQVYNSENAKLFILSGKKSFVLDFCKKRENFSYLKFDPIEVDMGKLLNKLNHVNTVWFRFRNGLIKASALIGANIESTNDFKKYNFEGEISTLSFYYEYLKSNHHIMIVSDGTIVLHTSFQNISTELDLVMEIKTTLLDGLITPTK